VIPFNRAAVAPHQLELVGESFTTANLSGDGPFTKMATQTLSELHGGATVLLTPSCTAALELSALLLDLASGDEVIVPSFTFSSTAAAFALMGATIVFADVEAETLNIDPEQVAQLITTRTRAIAPVNYGGTPVSAKIRALADEHGVLMIEDNAHGLFAAADGRPLGTIGELSTLSFHQTKNITCGEGGALVINDPSFIERAEILREKGTDRARFFRGMVDKYSWVDVGSSYLLADVNAAILAAQLDHADEIQARRAAAWNHYHDALGSWATEMGAGMLEPAAGATPSYHLFGLLMPDHATRTDFLAHTKSEGVLAVFHYVPLHSAAAGRRVGSAPLGCPVSSDVSDRLVRLPLFSDIKVEEYERVAEVVATFGR